MKRRKMKKIELGFLALFVAILVTSVLSATFFKMWIDDALYPGSAQLVSLALLLIDFPVAGVTAVYASLSIREEEEEKTQVLD